MKQSRFLAKLSQIHPRKGESGLYTGPDYRPRTKLQHHGPGPVYLRQWNKHRCRWNRHRPVCQQHATLSQKVRGHYAYYGITGNGRALQAFLEAVKRCWRKWLDRRNRQREMIWDRFNRLLKRYPLPSPKVVHSVYVRQQTHDPRNRML